MSNLPRKVNCNDRKLDTMTLKAIEPKRDGENFHRDRSIQLQVYAVPVDNYRGAETHHFKVIVNDVVVESPDIQELRKKALDLFRGLVEGERSYEKVLVVKTTGSHSPAHLSYISNDFGLQWEIGWRVPSLDLVFDQTKTYLIDVENYDEPEEVETVHGFKIGCANKKRGSQAHKTAVIPWTQHREDMLSHTIEMISKMRDDLNTMLLQPKQFAEMIDLNGKKLLTSG